MRHVIPISGKDSLTTYIIQSRNYPRDYELIFNDTGLELPETYDWLNRIEKKLNVTITRIGCDLIEIIHTQGILPSPRVRFCTRLAKIYPMEDYFGKTSTTVYFGVRADESNRGGYKPSKRASIIPVYPLIEANVRLVDVYSILAREDLLPPTFFWRELHERVKANVGEGAISQLSKIEFDFLFSWRSRPNCYNCFYQRQYEFIGLAEFHPELFQEACELERKIGGDDYSLRQGYFLSDLVEKRGTIISRREKQVTKIISGKSQLSFFPKADDLSFTSCGLFCGK